MDLKTLRTPCYTLDLAIAKNNANVMIERAESLGCTLRPHVKTHKTIEGALLQTGGRKSGIVVSTIKEAEFYADNGFTDILYAVPITPDKVWFKFSRKLKIVSQHKTKPNRYQPLQHFQTELYSMLLSIVSRSLKQYWIII